MSNIHESILDTFYSRFERRDVELAQREGAGKRWYVIRFADNDPMRQVGYTDETEARRRFAAIKTQNQTE